MAEQHPLIPGTGGGGGGGAVTIADGADVAEGTTTDAAKTDVTLAGTVLSFLKGAVKILADVWDSVNHRLKVDGSGVTQPISAASLPLPTNAARETGGNLDQISSTTGSTLTQIIDIKSAITGAPLATEGGGTEAAALRVTIANDSTGLLSVDDNGGSLTVDGPLTNTELRATPVPVSGTVTTGGLTDTQLRATPVPVSGTVAVTNAGLTNLDVALSTRTKPADQQHTILDSGVLTSITNALPAGTNVIGHVIVDSGVVTTGGLTDTQLRATPVPISGSVTVNTISGFALDSTVAKDATLLTIDTDIKATQPRSITSVVPGTGATNLGKAEDQAAADGDVGIANLGVRQDVPITDTSNVGDYVFMKTDQQGRLWVNSDILGTMLNRQYDLLQQILMEMRISNAQLQEGLNTRGELDNLRQDPYYNSVN